MDLTMSDLTKKVYMNASEQGWKYTAVKSDDTIDTFINVEVLKEWMYCNYGAMDFMTQFENFIK